MRMKIKVNALSQSTTAYLKLRIKPTEFSTNPEQIILIFFHEERKTKGQIIGFDGYRLL